MRRVPIEFGFMPNRRMIEYVCAGYPDHPCKEVLSGPESGNDKPKRCPECSRKYHMFVTVNRYRRKNKAKLNKHRREVRLSNIRQRMESA